jgi:hypothetical protein
LEVYGPEVEIAKFAAMNYQIGQETEVLKSPEMITFTFQTAWDPPSKFVEQMAKDFRALRFDLYYYEPTSWVAGALEFSNGQIKRDEFYENDDDAVEEFVMEQFNTDINMLTLQ